MFVDRVLTSDDRLGLVRATRNLRSLIRVSQTPSLRRFVPNGAQERIIRGVSSDVPVLFIGCGNRVGKTSAAVNVLGSESFGPQSSWFDNAHFRRVSQIPDRMYVIASEPEFINDGGALRIEIEKWLTTHRRRYKEYKGTKPWISLYEFDNGIRWKVMSYGQAAKEFEGATVYKYWLDEPPPEAIWRACWSRRLSGAEFMITATPLSGCSHIYDDVVIECTEEIEPNYFVSPDRRCAVIYGDIEENCRIHGVRGRLYHEDIEDAIAKMPVEERQARAHGKFMFLSGNVYKNFKDDSIVENPSTYGPLRHTNGVIPVTFPRILVMDPHDKIPPYMFWAAILPDDSYLIYDEWPMWDDVQDFCKLKQNPYDMGWDTAAAAIKSHEKIWGEASQRHMDKRGEKFTVDQEFNVLQFFNRKMNIKFREHISDGRGDDNIEAGHALVRQRLGAGRLMVLRRCRQLINMMQRYRYGDWKGKTGEGKAPKEEVEERYKHGPDCLRYLCQLAPKYHAQYPVRIPQFDYSSRSSRSYKNNPFSVMK